MFGTTRPSTFLLATVATLMVAACRRGDDAAAASDSALARDLTLANAISAPTPALRDVPEPTPPVSHEPAPSPRRERAPARAPVRERPRSAAPTPAPAPPPAVDSPAPEPMPAPAPARRVGLIAAGTSVGLTTESRACSDANRPGDKMVAHTSEAITGTDGVVFPAGSPVVIEVASVVRSASADSATITFRVKSITANGVTYAASGDVVPTGTVERTRVATKSADTKKVVGGAILGAVIGRVAGGGTRGTVVGAAAGAAVGAAAAAGTARYETCVPAGAPLRLTLGAPVEVEL